MRSMSHWPLTREDISRPAYRSLAQGLAAAIDSGSLRAGEKLPPHRDLAWRLGVSVQTVSRAYEELIRADLISGEVGRGTFVKSGPRETVEVPWFRAATDRPPIDLSMMTPVRLPAIAEAWLFFHLDDLLQGFNPEAFHGFFRFVLDSQIEQVVGQLRSNQELRR